MDDTDAIDDPATAAEIKRIMVTYGADEPEARFILAIVRGESTGDAVLIGDDGTPVPDPDANPPKEE